MWQSEADAKRHPRTRPERQQLQRQWEAHLDVAVAVLGLDQLSQVWAEATQVLERAWRGSMLAECVNRYASCGLGSRSVGASTLTKAVWNCFAFCTTSIHFNAANALAIVRLNWLAWRCRMIRSLC